MNRQFFGPISRPSDPSISSLILGISTSIGFSFIIGLTSVGESTILNELYGFNESSPGMLPPFTMQLEETRALARHYTTRIELGIFAERLILLDTQPLFSPSILSDMIRLDGSSSVSILNGESLSADLAHELMGIQEPF
ncbi:uncharacterized protein LOC131253990 [Magnolia sinica]|uniref:uncharacterized protein LOC131253990 n=1 Tax=Magnolia sinica TaxID=86752 RepID=UPI00265A6FB6|nr:uncharacterized protein LOC131253990 [Magnolia sinica]